MNPKIVAGVVATNEAGILMCKRAIEPRIGYWTLPAGYMEVGESVEDAARREAREEACAELELDQLLAVYSVPRISQVQIFFRARLVNTPKPGPESQAVAVYPWADIPWDHLAFPTVSWALRAWHRTRADAVFAPALRTAADDERPPED